MLWWCDTFTSCVLDLKMFCGKPVDKTGEDNTTPAMELVVLIAATQN